MKSEATITDQLVKTYFDIITSVDGGPLALVVPTESGQHTYALMASALKQIEGQVFDTAVLITTSPSDEGFYQAKGNISTPLGALKVNQEAARVLVEKFLELQPVKLDGNQQSDLIAERFPVLLSFLKHAAPDTEVVPVLIPKNAIEMALELGKYLPQVVPSQRTVVISQTAFDQTLMATLEFNNPEVFSQAAKLYVDRHSEQSDHLELSGAPAAAALGYAHACGGNTVSILQEHSQHNLKQAAIMLWNYQPPQLTAMQEGELQQLASRAIETYVCERRIPDFQSGDSVLNRKAGVFVTLRIKRMLRGCIGHLSADRPLAKAVQEMAIAAATSDPRFPPLTEKEIKQITTKIAILSPMKRIKPEQVEVGKHGLLISHEGRRGVLLPEVATDRNWDAKTFLENLCRKAGLPANAWLQNPKLYAFTSVVIGND